MSKFQAFDVAGRLFRVTFKTNVGMEVLTPNGDLTPCTETHCYITSAEAPFKLYASGVAACSATDVYDASEGRERALLRALRDAEDVVLDWDKDASAWMRVALRAAMDRGEEKVDAEGSPADLWADWDDTLAEVDETSEIIDWHRADARRLGIEPSTPDGTVMSMYDYHRVFRALKARQR